MALLGKDDKVVVAKQNVLAEIQRLKGELSAEELNNAVRRYHFVLKTLNGIDFQINMENKSFYQDIFKQCLLEQKMANPKSF